MKNIESAELIDANASKEKEGQKTRNRVRSKNIISAFFANVEKNSEKG